MSFMKNLVFLGRIRIFYQYKSDFERIFFPSVNYLKSKFVLGADRSLLTTFFFNLSFLKSTYFDRGSRFAVFVFLGIVSLETLRIIF
jgi:hypothetical protein